jgi:UMF1 family MFS transporter
LHLKALSGLEKPAFLTIAGSMVACAFFVPVAGELSDRTDKTKTYLVRLTLLACVLVSAMSLTLALPLLLLLLFAANFCYQAALPFYDSMLPTVAPPRKMGLISGIGVGLGYGGVAFALPVAFVVIGWAQRIGMEQKLQPLFALAGAMFFLFSLPLIFFVPSKPAGKRTPGDVNLLRLAARRVMITLRLLPRHRHVMLFLIGNFLCVDALNTGIVAASPFMVHVHGMSEERALLWFIPFTLCAVALSYLGGRLTDRFGPRRTMIAAALCIMASVAVAAFSPSFAVFIVTFMVLGGFGLSTTWVAGRRLLVRLVPEGQVGKYFGLYDVGRKLALFGLIFFAVLADLLPLDIQIGGIVWRSLGHRLGLLALVPLLAAGIWCLSKVDVSQGRGR